LSITEMPPAFLPTTAHQRLRLAMKEVEALMAVETSGLRDVREKIKASRKH